MVALIGKAGHCLYRYRLTTGAPVDNYVWNIIYTQLHGLSQIGLTILTGTVTNFWCACVIFKVLGNKGNNNSNN